MCTSTGANPARSNAAAISTWLLTPCSRRIATRGRAPVAMNGAAMSVVGIEREPPGKPRVIGSSRRAPRSSSAQAGSSRSCCMRQRGLRPGGAQLHAVVVDEACRPRPRCGSGGPAATLPMTPRESSESVPRRAPPGPRATSRVAHLQHGAEFLAEQRCHTVAATVPRSTSMPQRPANAISQQRDGEAAVGTVVIGEHETASAQLADRRKE